MKIFFFICFLSSICSLPIPTKIPLEICCGDFQTICGSRCVDTEIDPQNCGGCSTTCGIGSICRNGVCLHKPKTKTKSRSICCDDGFTNCQNGCVDLNSDPSNCRVCGYNCSGKNWPGCCFGNCVDFSNENSNCGSCGNQCGFLEQCFGGICNTYCSCGSEVALIDTQTNIKNCGGCGASCSPNNIEFNSCSGGNCDGVCFPGWANCDNTLRENGCNINTNSDSENCGSCGNICAAGFSCFSGVCKIGCTPGSGIVNGNFATGFSGWIHTGSTDFDYTCSSFIDGTCSTFSDNPSCGNTMAILGPFGFEAFLSQTVTGCSGLCGLNFELLGIGDNPSHFTVEWNGVQVYSSTNPNTNNKFSLQKILVQCTGNDNFQFSYRDDPGYLGLSCVSLF